MDAGQAAGEMVKILHALEHTKLLLAGTDQAAAATDLASEPRYSPLRTAVEQALHSAEEVRLWLRSERT
jgi:hypothetical protein